MITKSGTIYDQVGSMNTELTSIRGILDGIGAADISVNLGEITSFPVEPEMIQGINSISKTLWTPRFGVWTALIS